MSRLSIAVVCFLGVLASSCTINLSQSTSAPIAKNQCNADSDCGHDGECWNQTCVAHNGTLQTLLLSLTPPVSTPVSGIGGLRFLQVATGLLRSNEQHDLDLNGASTVRGYLRSTCPFEVTLTSEEQSFGLPAPTYVAYTSPTTTAASACDKLTLSGPTQEFVVQVPPGKYDVYARPTKAVGAAADGGAPSCDTVPQLFPGIVQAKAGVSCYALGNRATTTLDVRIPWPATAAPLDGWTVDVVHPVTGQVLSAAAKPLSGPPEGSGTQTTYTRSVTYSPIASTPAGQEVLRLSPPTPADGPVLQFSVAAVIASSPSTAGGAQRAILPSPLGPFPPKVHVDGWVWRKQDLVQRNQEVAVQGTVTFQAMKLDMPTNGIFASFSTTVMVGSDGYLSTDLFPGSYRVGVIPSSNPNDTEPLAAQEWSWPVVPSNETSGSEQGAKTLEVDAAATVKGRVFSALGPTIAGSSVQAIAASTAMRRCEADAASCMAAPVGVLETSLAESAYVPRTASGVTGGDGRFTLTGVDCGGCKSGQGAAFDLVVQPTDGTRLPWTIMQGVNVDGTTDLGDVRGSLPILERGKVQVLSSSGAAAVPGALIKAYVLRDASGSPIVDLPESGLPSCSTGAYTAPGSGTRCIRSVLQVAETRADSSGAYELVLPSSLDATTP